MGRTVFQTNFRRILIAGGSESRLVVSLAAGPGIKDTSTTSLKIFFFVYLSQFKLGVMQYSPMLCLPLVDSEANAVGMCEIVSCQLVSLVCVIVAP